MTLLVRHAESEWNLHFGPSRIDMGLHDPPLTPAGRDQAEAAVDGLRGEELTRHPPTGGPDGDRTQEQEKSGMINEAKNDKGKKKSKQKEGHSRRN